ncbi:hypothetical protein L1887_52063 [Cichorium endivia]|nr:hypothetical protein L1887_52063 [Cichorium endivia]
MPSGERRQGQRSVSPFHFSVSNAILRALAWRYEGAEPAAEPEKNGVLVRCRWRERQSHFATSRGGIGDAAEPKHRRSRWAAWLRSVIRRRQRDWAAWVLRLAASKPRPDSAPSDRLTHLHAASLASIPGPLKNEAEKESDWRIFGQGYESKRMCGCGERPSAHLYKTD